MQEHRLKIAAIAANVQGVNVDNFIKFCNTLEGWVGEPASDELKNPGNQEPETDWSRPQLVKSTLSGCIIQTNGIHDADTFKGVVIEKGDSDWPQVGDKRYEWLKINFVYHGEIPEEPQTAFMSFTEALGKLPNGWGMARRCWDLNYPLIRDGDILIVRKSGVNWYDLSIASLLANDWQIIKP